MDWLHSQPRWMEILFTASLVSFVASLAFVPLGVALLPTDYFAEEHAPAPRWELEHPLARIALLVLKNALGLALVICGIALLALPGQGLIAIALGLGLMNFPGKRRLELAIVRRPAVLAALNWIRRKCGRAPLRVHGCR